MKLFWLTLIGLTTPLIVCSQSVTTFMGARVNGLGNSTACAPDEWSIFNNIGTLSKSKETKVAFTYDYRPRLEAANRAAVAIVVPTPLGVVSTGAFRFGDELYSEQMILAGYSNSFGITSLGVRAHYIHYQAEGFRSKGVVSISFGTFTQLTPKLSIGAHVVNINKPRLSFSENERIPTILVAGLGFTPSEKIFITTEIEKALDREAQWKSGIEYKAHKKFQVRTGISMMPSAGYFGFTFKPGKISIDYAYRYHPVLGGSHQTSIAYKLARK